MFWLLVFYGLVRKLFRVLKKWTTLYGKMCLCIYKLFKLYLQRRSCLFLQKGEKTAELVFLFRGKLGAIFQNSPVYSFLIFTYSSLAQHVLI